MLALSGMPLGCDFVFVDPNPDSPASTLGCQIVAPYDDQAALKRLAQQCDVVTCEFESVPEVAARAITGLLPFHPNAYALATAQDRLIEKQAFERLGIPTAPYHAIDQASDIPEALEAVGNQGLLKTRRLGYDGKGQRAICDATDAVNAFADLGNVPCILEGLVAFDREVSLVATRAPDGCIAFYPLVENHHYGGILRLTLAPAPRLNNELQQLAEAYVRSLMEHLNYVGTLTVEFFQVGPKLIANEFAPRVHNSGHWSIEGAATSQFENHMRAITGLPLGATHVRGHVAMLNLVGTIPDSRAVLVVRDAHVHLYGKPARPQRKLGHLTVLASSSAERAAKLRVLVPRLVACGSYPRELDVSRSRNPLDAVVISMPDHS
jgi:5-(carboxyamino)imidazole ribonucleotide synthase